MQTLDTSLPGNTLRAWLTALAIATLVAGGLRLIEALVVRRLQRVARHTRNTIDDVIVDVIDNTRLYFLLFPGVRAGSRHLAFPEPADRVPRAVAGAATVVQAAAWADVRQRPGRRHGHTRRAERARRSLRFTLDRARRAIRDRRLQRRR